MPRSEPSKGVSPSAIAGEQGKFFELNKYGSLNTQATRPAIGEQDFAWLENLMPIGEGNMRCLPSSGGFIYTAPPGLRIIYFYCYNIGAQTFAAIFHDDGSAVQINLATIVGAIIAPAGVFFPGDASLGNPAPAAVQWQSSGIVITDTASTNGFYAWDGANLFAPGAPAPDWLTNLTPTVMPSGVSGTCLEAFQERMWVGRGVVLFNSAPGNGADFSGPSGGGAAPQNDSTLRREITQLRKSNGFMYLFGDSEINVISNPNTDANGVTTYNNQNIDDKIGTPWHNSVQGFNGAGFNGALLFGNATGIYAVQGGQALKISGQALDGILAASGVALQQDPTIAQPSSAVATIYGIPVYMLLIPAQDPFTKAFRNILAMFDGTRWFLGSQDSPLTFIGTQEINSQISAYGTDGTHFFKLFDRTSSTLRKILISKLWSGKSWLITKDVLRVYAQAQDNSGSGYSITGNIDLVNENSAAEIPVTITSATQPLQFTGLGGAQLNFAGLGGVLIIFSVEGLTLNGQNTNSTGALVGVTLQSTSPDFTLIALALLYREKAMIGG